MEIFFIIYGLVGLGVAAFALRWFTVEVPPDPNDDRTDKILFFLLSGLMTLIIGGSWPLVLFGWGFYRLATIGLKR